MERWGNRIGFYGKMRKIFEGLGEECWRFWGSFLWIRVSSSNFRQISRFIRSTMLCFVYKGSIFMKFFEGNFRAF